MKFMIKVVFQMCRYMMTEQFLGITFANLIEKNVFNIEISLFTEIEKKVDKIIRKYNDTMLCVSLKEIYSTVEEYNDFFEVRGSRIEVKDNIKNKLTTQNNKKNFICILNNYFSEGIPTDINKSVNKVLNAEFKEVNFECHRR